MNPRPPRVLPFIEVRVEPDRRQFENGLRYLSQKFAEQEAELERLRTIIYDRKKNELDSGIR